MTLSLPHMISKLGGLPYPHLGFSWPLAVSDSDASPAFLHAGYASPEPDLAQEVRRVDCEEASCLEGEVP